MQCCPSYHVEHLHPALTRHLDLSSYSTKVAPKFSIQEVAGLGDARVGDNALYCFLHPALMINR